MKKLFLIASALFLTTSVYAQTATPAATITSTATPSAQQQLDTIKDRLASAATQLQQSQKRAIFGTVKETSVSTITVSTKTSDVKIELTDTIKVFQILKGKRTALTTDQISKGDDVVIFGDYDTNLDILKAQVVFIQNTIPERISGTITAVSKKDYTITVLTQSGQSYVVDYETTTKAFSWDAAGGTQKAGFAKFFVGDTAHVLETPETNADNRVSAIRILDIGNLSGVTPTPTPTATASATLTPTP
jgi:uncharacterized protein (UPF0262 family)